MQAIKSSYLGPFIALAKKIKEVFVQAESNLKFLSRLQGNNDSAHASDMKLDLCEL